jgi:3-hydroxyacyl-CoA dehydrogenase/enoyl-CoA hydratase/3-hydroxybutyryl-CoA epimerase
MSLFRLEFVPADAPGPGAAGEVAHLVMDDPARAENVLDEPALAELEEALAGIEARPGLRGLVLRSGKPGSFLTGVDVEELAGHEDRGEVLAQIRRRQRLFGRLAALPFPTVAAIEGMCLGAGTELALTCSSRVAAEEPGTRIGLPQILLGAIPAAGGTTRLPHLTGLSAALDLILGGRPLDGREAERVGLVVRAVPGVWLPKHARRRLAELAPRSPGEVPRRDRWRAGGLRSWLVDGTPFGRGWTFARARARMRARADGRYPAPIAALSVLHHGFAQSADVSLRLEAEWMSDLTTGPVCRSMVRAFRLGERARREPPAVEAAAPLERLQVVGAGATGTAVTALASRSGLEVRLRDTDPAALTRALRALRARVLESRGGRAARHEIEAQLARVFPGTELAGLRRADCAIEAVGEDLDAKRRVFGELEVRMRPEALLATTTSTLSVDELASGLQHPGRFVGLHFPHPAQRVPLVEIVRGARTTPSALATAFALARRLGRTPIVVSDTPGFVVHRILVPYLRESLHLLEEGFRVTDVDGAMRRFGMPMGPCETMDEMGLDAVARLTGALSQAFPGRVAPAPALDEMVTEGRLGRKSGVGFYRYRGRRRAPDAQTARRFQPARERRSSSLHALAERMALVMVNEAAHAVEEGVVAGAGILDLALLYGAGFPPFRGGPLRYADALGAAKVEARLSALRAEKGERFLPAPWISRLSAEGGTFTAPLD